MTRRKKEEIREVEFYFSDDGGLDTESCELCGSSFYMPEIVTMLRGFYICPICVLGDVSFTVKRLEKRIADRSCLQGCSNEDPEDQEAVLEEYLAVAKTLRRSKYVQGDHFRFSDIPGGLTAAALAGVSRQLEDLARSGADKAGKVKAA
jgi:hypothetical protein